MRDSKVLGKFTANDISRPTMRLRWHAPNAPSFANPTQHKVLQQCWITGSGAEEWRDIPTYIEPSTPGATET